MLEMGGTLSIPPFSGRFIYLLIDYSFARRGVRFHLHLRAVGHRTFWLLIPARTSVSVGDKIISGFYYGNRVRYAVKCKVTRSHEHAYFSIFNESIIKEQGTCMEDADPNVYRCRSACFPVFILLHTKVSMTKRSKGHFENVIKMSRFF